MPNSIKTIHRIARTKAIRKKCLECKDNKRKAVTYCREIECPLYPWRFGREPRPDDYVVVEDEEYQMDLVRLERIHLRRCFDGFVNPFYRSKNIRLKHTGKE